MKQVLDERSMLEGTREEAKAEGRAEGIIESKKEDIIEILSDIGPITEGIQNTIKKETDINKLKAWIRIAARCSSIEEFKALM